MVAPGIFIGCGRLSEISRRRGQEVIHFAYLEMFEDRVFFMPGDPCYIIVDLREAEFHDLAMCAHKTEVDADVGLVSGAKNALFPLVLNHQLSE